MLLKPRIAIVGAGFSGLAAAWHLSDFDLTLISQGGEASKISAGLLHKYVGLKSKKSALNDLASEKTEELLQVSEAHLGKSPVLSKGILRIALTEAQKAFYQESARIYEDVVWLDESAVQAIDNNLPKAPGILIESGMSIDTQNYLEGLRVACQKKGMTHRNEHIQSLDQLEDYDFIVLAMGADAKNVEPCQNLPIHPLKGQLLELKWPTNLPPLRYSLISQTYMAMTEDSKRLVVGATYEHQFASRDPDPEMAIAELLPKAIELYPPLAGSVVLEVKSGLRASSTSRSPIMKRISPKVWVLTGMGSRGLLYHAYFAEKLASEIKSAIKGK